MRDHYMNLVYWTTKPIILSGFAAPTAWSYGQDSCNNLSIIKDMFCKTWN